MHIDGEVLKSVRTDIRIGTEMPPMDVVAAALTLGAEVGTLLLARHVADEQPSGIRWTLLAHAASGVTIVRAVSPHHNWDWSSDAAPPGAVLSAEWLPPHEIEAVELHVKSVRRHSFSAGDLVGYETWALRPRGREAIKMHVSDYQDAQRFTKWFRQLQSDLG